MKKTLTALALALALPLAAVAKAPPLGGLDDAGERPHGFDPAKMEEHLRGQHARLVAELAASLNLDDASIVKLGNRLKKFDDQRVTLRMKQFGLMRDLRHGAKGDAKIDAAALARDLARTQVEIAQLNEQELNEILQGLSPENAQKAVYAVGRVMREGRGGHGGGFRHGR